jgi:hypothetical protein
LLYSGTYHCGSDDDGCADNYNDGCSWVNDDSRANKHYDVSYRILYICLV